MNDDNHLDKNSNSEKISDSLASISEKQLTAMNYYPSESNQPEPTLPINDDDLNSGSPTIRMQMPRPKPLTIDPSETQNSKPPPSSSEFNTPNDYSPATQNDQKDQKRKTYPSGSSTDLLNNKSNSNLLSSFSIGIHADDNPFFRDEKVVEKSAAELFTENRVEKAVIKPNINKTKIKTKNPNPLKSSKVIESKQNKVSFQSDEGNTQLTEEASIQTPKYLTSETPPVEEFTVSRKAVPYESNYSTSCSNNSTFRDEGSNSEEKSIVQSKQSQLISKESNNSVGFAKENEISQSAHDKLKPQVSETPKIETEPIIEKVKNEIKDEQKNIGQDKMVDNNVDQHQNVNKNVNENTDKDVDKDINPIENVNKNMDNIRSVDKNVGPIENVNKNMDQVRNVDKNMDQIRNVDKNTDQIGNVDKNTDQIGSVDENVIQRKDTDQYDNKISISTNDPQFEPNIQIRKDVESNHDPLNANDHEFQESQELEWESQNSDKTLRNFPSVLSVSTDSLVGAFPTELPKRSPHLLTTEKISYLDNDSDCSYSHSLSHSPKPIQTESRNMNSHVKYDYDIDDRKREYTKEEYRYQQDFIRYEDERRYNDLNRYPKREIIHHDYGRYVNDFDYYHPRENLDDGYYMPPQMPVHYIPRDRSPPRRYDLYAARSYPDPNKHGISVADIRNRFQTMSEERRHVRKFLLYNYFYHS